VPGRLSYSMDTSALLDWWVRYYPPRVFKGLVPRMEVLVEEGRLRASREVRDEVEYENEGLRSWLKAQEGLWLDSDEAVQRIVANLMDRHYNPEKPDKGIHGADPFVIAVAAMQRPMWAVVSGGKARKHRESENPVRVPGLRTLPDPAPLVPRIRDRGGLGADLTTFHWLAISTFLNEGIAPLPAAEAMIQRRSSDPARAAFVTRCPRHAGFLATRRRPRSISVTHRRAPSRRPDGCRPSPA